MRFGQLEAFRVYKGRGRSIGPIVRGRHDTQYNDIHHNDTQHNDTQHKGLTCDTEHK
jgi:hypothetical protein